MEIAERVEVLRQSTFLSCFDDNEIDTLANLAIEIDLRQGGFLFNGGDLSNNIYTVANGIIKTVMYSPSGKELILSFRCANDVVGEAAFLTGKPYVSSALALTRTEILAITRRDFAPYLCAHHELYIRTIEVLVQRLVDLQCRLEDFAGSSAEQRLLRVLVSLHTKFGCSLPLTKYSIAEMAGLAPETTIRIMSSLEKKGVISSSRGNVTILEIDRLEGLTLA